MPEFSAEDQLKKEQADAEMEELEQHLAAEPAAAAGAEVGADAEEAAPATDGGVDAADPESDCHDGFGW